MAIIDIRGASVSSTDPPIATNPNPDLAIKAPVRAATTGGNITLAGLQTLDGVSLAAGDRVLVKDQSDPTTNGIYNAATGPWTRTIDAANNSQWSRGVQVLVTDGATNAGSTWDCTAATPVVLGTSAVTWAQITNPPAPPVMAAKTVLGNAGASPAAAQNLNWPVITGGTRGQTIIKNSSTAGDASWADGLWLNIEAFGGKGDNTTDNTAALNAALAALTGQGGGVYFPAGKYRFNTAVTFNLPAGIFSVTLVGAGQDATELTWPGAAGGITFNHAGANSSVHLRDLTLSTGVASGGTALTLNLSTVVTNPGVAAASDIYRVTLRGADGYLQSDFWTTGLAIANVSDVQIDNLTVAGSSTQQGVGTTITGLPGSSAFAVEVNIAKSNYCGLATGIVYGSFVQGITVDQTNFTFVTQGIISQASETGALVQLAVTNSQFNPRSANGGVGIQTNTLVASLQILNNFFDVGGPNQIGVDVPQAGHFLIAFNQLQGLNSNAAIGIRIGARQVGSPGIVTHNDIYGFSTGGIGILLQAGSQSVTVDGNTFTSNATTISDLGTNNVKINNYGNPGYNPVGMSAPATMGASPFVVTAGGTPETHYIVQTSGAALISKSGFTIASLQNNVYAVVELDPFESYSTTWNTAAPTFTKDVH